jgi:Rnl2 family RNA ligase
MSDKREFSKYSSIENHYRDRYLSKIRYSGIEGPYIATIKIHGSNFCTSYNVNEDKVRYAKRSGWLGEDESFFDHLRVVERLGLEDKIKALYGNLMDRSINNHIYDGLVQIDIYGELFGGGIQKEVYYGDEKSWAVFDAKLRFEDGRVEWMERDHFQSLCEFIGFYVATEIARFGTLEEALDFNILDGFTNKIGSEIDMGTSFDPARATEANQIPEGVVIKPVKVQYLHDLGRVVIKKKHPTFKDKKNVDKEPKKLIPMTEDEAAVFAELDCYITEARFADLISKIGTVTSKDYGKLVGMFIKDVIEDFNKDYPDVLAGIPKSSKHVVTKAMNKSVADFIRLPFSKIVV